MSAPAYGDDEDRFPWRAEDLDGLRQASLEIRIAELRHRVDELAATLPWPARAALRIWLRARRLAALLTTQPHPTSPNPVGSDPTTQPHPTSPNLGWVPRPPNLTPPPYGGGRVGLARPRSRDIAEKVGSTGWVEPEHRDPPEADLARDHPTPFEEDQP